MGEVSKHRLAIYFSSFSHVKKIIIFLCFTLPFLSPCWIAVMAASQPLVSLTSTNKGPNSQEDSLAICNDSYQEDEFNMTHLYLLLAQQEATCLQEYVSHLMSLLLPLEQFLINNPVAFFRLLFFNEALTLFFRVNWSLQLRLNFHRTFSDRLFV